MVGSFLQSAAWGEVQAAYGREIQWLEQAGQRILAIQYPLPLQQWYWFIPHGNYVDGLHDGAVFVRYEPEQVPAQDKHVHGVHPSTTLLTSLGAPDKMLQAMKQKCRYNMHLAEKKGVQVFSDTSADIFYDVLAKTSTRQKIKLHPKKYYDTIISVLQSHQMVKVYRAEYQQHTVAVALVVYYNGVATYVHGGSDYTQRALMAPYLLHWQIMQDAQTNGYHTYDWFGIAPEDEPNHPFSGITRFKLGFGGSVVSRPGTFEHPLRPLWYTGYRMMKRLWI